MVFRTSVAIKHCADNDANTLQNQANCDIINEHWITVKGTPVLVDDDGNLQGEVGEKIQGETKESGVPARELKKDFKPTKANTKEFKNFDWEKEARNKETKITALEVDGELAGLVSTRFNSQDKSNGGVFINLLESAGADADGKGAIHKGSGRALIADAVSQAVDQGVDMVYLTPTTKSIPIYRHLGFEPMGQYLALEGAAFEKFRRG